MTGSRYTALTAVALGLTGCQLLLLPRLLTAHQFGLVVLSISMTQLVLQVGDFGFSRLSLDGTASPEERARHRMEGQALTRLTTLAVVAVCATLWWVLRSQRPLLGVLALGALAGAVVTGNKFRAAEREVAGDEMAAATGNFLWTNAPKIGMLLALVAFRSAIPIVLTSAVIGMAVCGPYRAPLRLAFAALRRFRQWGPPFVTIAAGFLLMWMDTYFLGIRMGVDGAGAYEAVYRIVGLCTYAFLPWVSVVTSRVSLGVARPLGWPLTAALASAGLVAGAAGAVVTVAGPRLFPHFDLPLHVVPPLVLYFVLSAGAYCVGSALFVRSRFATVSRCAITAVLAAVGGHLLFTLRGGPGTAAWVAAASMAVNVGLLAHAYRSAAASSPSQVAASD